MNWHNLRKKAEDLRREAEIAEREGNLEKVAKIVYGELPQAEKEFKIYEKKFTRQTISEKGKAKNAAEKSFIKESVDEEDIASVISRWTGIPVSRMLESEVEKLSKIEDILSHRVIGQAEAIKAIANALRRARAGLSQEDKPFGSFMFYDEKALIRIDMSEYMERHAVSRLIGSPPGYVGHEEGGQLTETVRHRPYSLILFDEIEKANPEVFNILLQILDNGRLTDGKGKIVNFKNCVIIMTSNVGGEYFRQMSYLGFSVNEDEKNLQFQEENFRDKVRESLRQTFKPEFLNRLDEVIIFNSLRNKDIAKIVDIQLEQVKEKLAERQIKLTVDPSLKKYLIDNGFEPEYGARPIKRLIQKVILDNLADKIIKGDVKNGQKIKLSFRQQAVEVVAS